MARRSRRLLAIMVALAATAACGDGGGPDAAPATAGLPGAEVAEGLCQAAQRAGDAEQAEKAFARVHTQLHVVARAVEAEDRAAAGRLLVAKQKVEDDLHRGAPAAELRPDLEALIAATADGLARLDVTVAPCDG